MRPRPEITQKSMSEKASDSYLTALAERFSHVDNFLTRALIASISQEAWQRDPGYNSRMQGRRKIAGITEIWLGTDLRDR